MMRLAGSRVRMRTIVVGHHGAVGLAALRAFDDVGCGMAVVAYVEGAFVGGFGKASLSRLFVAFLRVDDACVLLAVLRSRFRPIWDVTPAAAIKSPSYIPSAKTFPPTLIVRSPCIGLSVTLLIKASSRSAFVTMWPSSTVNFFSFSTS